MDQFNIVQWNAQSIKNNKPFLETLLYSQKVSCALISETWLKSKDNFQISGYNIARQDRPDGYGGSCILIKNGIPFSILNCQNNNPQTQICAIQIVIDNKKINLVSIYSSPKHKTSALMWSNIFLQFSGLILIGGDFNAHHTTWGSEINNFEGRQILETVTDINLTILNDGSPTLLPRPLIRKSAIDLTLCSPTFAPNLNWSVINNTMGSIHFPILVTLNSSVNQQYTVFPNTKWNIKNADWSKYFTTSLILAQNISEDYFDSLDAENKYHVVIDIINRSAESSIPRKEIIKVNSFKCNIWWDDECKETALETNRVFKNYSNMSTYSNCIACKRAQAKASFTFKNKKKDVVELIL